MSIRWIIVFAFVIFGNFICAFYGLREARERGRLINWFVGSFNGLVSIGLTVFVVANL